MTSNAPLSSSSGSIQISGITVTLNRPTKGSPSIKLIVDGKTFSKHSFKDGETRLRWDLKPFLSIRKGSRLTIQLRKQHFHRWKNEILAEASISFGDAEKLLSTTNGQREDYKLYDDPSITVDFAPNSGTQPTMLTVGAEILADRKSMLDHLGRSRKFLETLMDLGAAASELHPTAKAILALVNVVYKRLQDQDQRNKLLLDLAENMASTLGYIEDVEQFARLVQLQKAIEEVRPLMEDTTNFILKYTSRSESANTMRSLLSSSVQDEIHKLTERFNQFKMQFDRGVAVQSGATLDALLSAITSTQDDELLAELKPRGLDRGSLIEECMDGTRRDILAMVDTWLENPQAPNILWLRGHPGVGKSAIASSLVARLTALQRLGSSFFFQREKASLMTPSALWRVVTFDLTRKYPTVRKTVVAKMNTNEIDLSTTNVGSFFRHFIHDSLSASTNIPPGRLPVIIIDALDECGGLDGQYSSHRKNLLHTLKSWSALPSGFKLIVTSRGEDDITRALSKISQPIDVLSGKMVSMQSSDDIRSFFKDQFLQIANGYPGSLPPEWPGSEIIQDLTSLAAGLFIWAKTVVELIVHGEPQEQLLRVQQGHMGHGDMTALYSLILDISFKEPSQRVLDAFQTVAGAIILAKVPLSRLDYIRLFSLEASRLDFICKGLHSVLATGSTLRFNHQSFVDFLVDPNRCPGMFLINREGQNRNFARACFQAMKSELRFNICEIPTSHACNKDIAGLDKKVEKAIFPHLSYPCRFWADHLLATAYNLELVADVEDFLYSRLLYWLEVLSLIEWINIASGMLLSIIEWDKARNEAVTSFSVDARRFVAVFGGVISQSAPHIYLSALPFAPKQSQIAQHFLPCFPRTLRLMTGRATTWPTIQKVLDCKREVISVAFSQDGKRIVSSSSDHAIRVWDAEIGDLVLGPFVGHERWVASVAFSPDCQRIVSGSLDGTIRVWRAETGEELLVLRDHMDGVMSVAFSHDGKHIVSGARDSAIRMRDAKTGSVVLELLGHTMDVASVAFSPDDKRIVSGSWDNTIRVWDVRTGNIVLHLTGHIHDVNCVAFSQDGKRIVSGSRDETIRVWDAKTGDTKRELLGGHKDSVRSVVFSQDGKHIASASGDCTILVWDAETGDVVLGPLFGHTRAVRSVAFSQDCKRIVSGSADGTLRVWDAEIGHMIRPFEGHTRPISSVAFSYDGKHIVSGSRDGTIRLWDPEKADTALGPLEVHSESNCFFVAFSKDRKHIFSVPLFGAIYKWSLETGDWDVISGLWNDMDICILAISQDGKRVVTDYDRDDAAICVWDVETGDAAPLVGPLKRHMDRAACVAFSQDGKHIVSTSADCTILVWDAKKGDLALGPLEGHTQPITSVAFSQDGKRIVSGSLDRRISVWDAETGDVVGLLEGHTKGVASVAFSPDDKRIVSGSFDNTIRVWDVRTGNIVLDLTGHIDNVTWVAFSQDGKRIVSGSDDCTIRVWDAEIGDVTPRPLEDCTIEDGWILKSPSTLLFWVPPWNREGLWWPRNTAVISTQGSTKVDLADFVHGESWTHCYQPSLFTSP